MGQNQSLTKLDTRSETSVDTNDSVEEVIAIPSAAPKILQLIKRYPVVVFTKAKCMICPRIKAILDNYEQCHPYVVVLEGDQVNVEVATAIEKATRRKLPVVFVGGEPIGGVDDIEDLHDTDELQELLEIAISSVDAVLCNVYGRQGEATFAGGSFHELEAAFCRVIGVTATAVGYAVTDDRSCRSAAVQVSYDTSIVKFEQLLEIFWDSHNPTVISSKKKNSAIFAQDDLQYEVGVESVIHKKITYGDHLKTIVVKLGFFDLADQHLQKPYLQKYPTLVQTLKLKTFDDIVLSPIAAKLNGFLSGDKTFQCQMIPLLPELNLPSSSTRELQRIIADSH